MTANSDKDFFGSKGPNGIETTGIDADDPSLVPPSKRPARKAAVSDLYESDHQQAAAEPSLYDMPLPNEQEAIPGNYIFTIGRSGGGKSTLQSHLLNYLYTQGEFSVEEDRAHLQSEQSYVEFQDLLLKWQRLWLEKKFPKRTDIGAPLAYRFITKPARRSRYPALPFGFFEISGERFRPLIDSKGEPPRLVPMLDNLLGDNHSKLAFLFVCQGTNMKDDDLLFSSFLRYLNVRHPGIRSRSSALLVLANPVACQKRLQLLRGQAPSGGRLEVREFVKACLPHTLNRLMEWERHSAISAFSVGTVREVQGLHGSEPVIEEVSFADARRIFEWIYQRFTGRDVGPGMFNRMVRSLNRLGSR